MFSLPSDNKTILASEYQLVLPSEYDLLAKMSEVEKIEGEAEKHPRNKRLGNLVSAVMGVLYMVNRGKFTEEIDEINHLKQISRKEMNRG